jgi:hypothetical protein
MTPLVTPLPFLCCIQYIQPLFSSQPPASSQRTPTPIPIHGNSLSCSLRTPGIPNPRTPTFNMHKGPNCPESRRSGGLEGLRVHLAPFNGCPDLQAIISVMVIGNGQDTTGPQTIREAEIGVGEVGQTCAHEVDEASPPNGRDLWT